MNLLLEDAAERESIARGCDARGEPTTAEAGRERATAMRVLAALLRSIDGQRIAHRVEPRTPEEIAAFKAMAPRKVRR